jgi:hypothetical protein
MSGLSKEQLDKITIEFLTVKIERMHNEIEHHMDEVNHYKSKIVKANKILDVIITKCQDRCDVCTCEVCCDEKCCEEYALREVLK